MCISQRQPPLDHTVPLELPTSVADSFVDISESARNPSSVSNFAGKISSEHASGV
ncbi:hypothetical protein PISMIDRAFT_671048, partial [Pisolithus microcarpus 441]